MEFACLGWPPDAPTLRLDYRRFAYAGKFVLGSTGKAVVRDGAADDGEFDDWVLAAASFSADRTDADRLVVRYVTVRENRRGEGLGPRLLAFVADRADDRGYDRVRIAVNNPVAYRAAHRAGFAFTGAETGLAELVCERPAARPADRPTDRYRDGLARYRDRDLGDGMAARLADWLDGEPPPVVDPPADADDGSGSRRADREPGR
ncbi:GNAT family N-acetyltransferase [Haloplanus pelagicus]|jgi:GNAT superfamily N-acetyltransferase|uniref:GNAT family N-acetyltransferase n=1 Tax=Haloplanus pelagicus TaxID=2949995 RepID=UPI0020410471|nr:GNAT family N-acetyltransferase [Haloplanus sp. HW8-1]